MQGRLRNRLLEAEIQTECGHCGRRIELWIDSELRWKSASRRGGHLIFEPDIDWSGFAGPSIIDDY